MDTSDSGLIITRHEPLFHTKLKKNLYIIELHLAFQVECCQCYAGEGKHEDRNIEDIQKPELVN